MHVPDNRLPDASIFITDISEEYLTGFLNGNMHSIQRIFAMDIISRLFDLSGINNSDRAEYISSIIKKYNFQSIYERETPQENTLQNKIFEGLTPDGLSAFISMNKTLKSFWNQSPVTVQDTLKKMTDTLQRSPGFFLALMRTDYSPVINKSVMEKKAFLAEVQKLIDSYANTTDIYDDLESYD